MWTQDDLKKLEKAIASGALQVRFADKEVTYQSTSDLLIYCSQFDVDHNYC